MDWYKREYERISAMGELQLEQEIKSLTESMNDPYPDDDLYGDIAVTMLLSHATAKLKEIQHASNTSS